MATVRERYLKLIADPNPGSAGRIAQGLLSVLAVGYRSGVGLRNWLYDSGLKPAHRLSLPVVSVGNLTTGGTGKTPFVAYLARWLSAHGARVVVLSRGYGRSDERELNDEGKVLKRLAPSAIQLQGKDRVLLARYAEAHFGPAVLVLDDGFQHRRLERDLDIVLVDATNPFGHGALLPRGLLREPPEALQRADLVVLSRVNQVTSRQRYQLHAAIDRLSGGRPVLEMVVQPVALVDADGRRQPLDELQAGRACAFCGLGNPEAFFALLRQLGCQLVGTRTFPDHHRYRRDEWVELCGWAQANGARMLVTTEKDIVKLPPGVKLSIPVLALRIDVSLGRGAKLLHALLRQLLRALPPGPARHAA